jgi:hypothetical protein
VQQDYADPSWIPDTVSLGCDEVSELLEEIVAESSALCRRRLADKILKLIRSSNKPLSEVDFVAFQRKSLAIMSGIIDEMPDCPEKYGVAYAIGSNNLAGRSMSEIAAKLGTTRALISHRAVEFCRRYQLPPSPYMKASR